MAQIGIRDFLCLVLLVGAIVLALVPAELDPGEPTPVLVPTVTR